MACQDLKNLKNRLDKLSALKSVSPDAEWKYTFRQALLIKAKTQSMAKIYEQKLADDLGFFGFVKNWQPRPALLPASAFALILFVFFGFSFGMVLASRGSLPGDVLFPVKLAVERTQLVTKTKPNEKTQFQIEITNRRTTELVQLAKTEGDATTRAEKIEQAVSEIEYQLNTVKKELPNIQTGNNPAETIKLAREATQKLADVEKTLNEVGRGVTEKELVKKIDSAANLADSASTQALTMVAQKMAEGTTKSSGAEKETLLGQVVEKIAKTEEKIKQISRQAQNISQNDSSAAAISADLVREQSKKAKEILNKAKESLQHDDLVVALETVKTAKEIVLGAENLVAEIQQQQQAAQDADTDKKATGSSATAAPANNSVQAGSGSTDQSPTGDQPAEPADVQPTLDGPSELAPTSSMALNLSE